MRQDQQDKHVNHSKRWLSNMMMKHVTHCHAFSKVNTTGLAELP